jgi:hypothetical protein
LRPEPRRSFQLQALAHAIVLAASAAFCVAPDDAGISAPSIAA